MDDQGSGRDVCTCGISAYEQVVLCVSACDGVCVYTWHLCEWASGVGVCASRGVCVYLCVLVVCVHTGMWCVRVHAVCVRGMYMCACVVYGCVYVNVWCICAHVV